MSLLVERFFATATAAVVVVFLFLFRKKRIPSRFFLSFARAEWEDDDEHRRRNE